MKKTTILLFCICITALLVGCLKHSTLVMLSEAPLPLSDKPTVLTPEQRLLRANRSLSIRMHLKEAWTPEPPWKDIRLQDDTVATITAVLVSDIGTHYYPMVIGAGDRQALRAAAPRKNDGIIFSINRGRAKQTERGFSTPRRVGDRNVPAPFFTTTA